MACLERPGLPFFLYCLDQSVYDFLVSRVPYFVKPVNQDATVLRLHMSDECIEVFEPLSTAHCEEVHCGWFTKKLRCCTSFFLAVSGSMPSWIRRFRRRTRPLISPGSMNCQTVNVSGGTRAVILASSPFSTFNLRTTGCIKAQGSTPTASYIIISRRRALISSFATPCFRLSAKARKRWYKSSSCGRVRT